MLLLWVSKAINQFEQNNPACSDHNAKIACSYKIAMDSTWECLHSIRSIIESKNMQGNDDAIIAIIIEHISSTKHYIKDQGSAANINVKSILKFLDKITEELVIPDSLIKLESTSKLCHKLQWDYKFIDCTSNSNRPEEMHILQESHNKLKNILTTLQKHQDKKNQWQDASIQVVHFMFITSDCMCSEKLSLAIYANMTHKNNSKLCIIFLNDAGPINLMLTILRNKNKVDYLPIRGNYFFAEHILTSLVKFIINDQLYNYQLIQKFTSMWRSSDNSNVNAPQLSILHHANLLAGNNSLMKKRNELDSKEISQPFRKSEELSDKSYEENTSIGEPSVDQNLNDFFSSSCHSNPTAGNSPNINI